MGRINNQRSQIASITSSSGHSLSDPQEIATELNHFFTNISAPEVDLKDFTLGKSPVGGSKQPSHFSISPTTEQEVASALSNLDPSKRGGVAQIPASVYQRLAPTVVPCLTQIINLSLSTSTFPKIYKQALVTPIFKKGDPSLPGNYRPISSLPILSKIFEKILNEQLIDHLNRNNLLSEKQFGFRKGVSTEQLILAITDQFNLVLDSKSPQYIAHLSLDVRKAFDSVHHDLLLHKLRSLFFFSDSAVDLFRSYLSKRSQCMKLGSLVSVSLPISKGVPQGSVLGPLLFNLMVNDLLSSHRYIFSYADDTLVFRSGATAVAALEAASLAFSDLVSWYRGNGLGLCPQKTICMLYSNRVVPSGLQVQVDGCFISVQSTARVLGFTLDSRLSHVSHVQRLVRETSNSLYALRKIRSFITKSDALIVYKSMIRSKLEYCSNVLYCSSRSSVVLDLEKCQNRAVRVVCGVSTNSASNSFSVSNAREGLGLTTLVLRRNSRFKRFVQRLLAGKGSSYLQSLVTNCGRHSVSLRNRCSYVLPSVRSCYGKNRFVFRAISILK